MKSPFGSASVKPSVRVHIPRVGRDDRSGRAAATPREPTRAASWSLPASMVMAEASTYVSQVPPAVLPRPRYKIALRYLDIPYCACKA